MAFTRALCAGIYDGERWSVTSCCPTGQGFAGTLCGHCQGLPTEPHLCSGGELSEEDPQGTCRLVDNTELGKIGTAA